MTQQYPSQGHWEAAREPPRVVYGTGSTLYDVSQHEPHPRYAPTPQPSYPAQQTYATQPPYAPQQTYPTQQTYATQPPYPTQQTYATQPSYPAQPPQTPYTQQNIPRHSVTVLDRMDTVEKLLYIQEDIIKQLYKRIEFTETKIKQMEGHIAELEQDTGTTAPTATTGIEKAKGKRGKAAIAETNE